MPSQETSLVKLMSGGIARDIDIIFPHYRRASIFDAVRNMRTIGEHTSRFKFLEVAVKLEKTSALNNPLNGVPWECGSFNPVFREHAFHTAANDRQRVPMPRPEIRIIPMCGICLPRDERGVLHASHKTADYTSRTAPPPDSVIRGDND